MGTITSTNSVIQLSVNLVYPNAQQLQGYSADDVFDIEEIDVAETSMGIDGLLSGGLIYVEIPWSISLQSNSPSCAVFDNWYNFGVFNYFFLLHNRNYLWKHNIINIHITNYKFSMDLYFNINVNMSNFSNIFYYAN